jgi:transcriptional regulator with XRE-family HTH domain
MSSVRRLSAAVARRDEQEHRLKERLRHLLREVREEAGLSQEALAGRMGLTQGYVSKLEAGEIRPDFVRVWQMCRAVGLPLDEFVRRLER